ncbi:unnamed protein product [Amoebophrya sp. A120]|nr:unnamed protein product [Amoebophrya sp. A120]|eukprot:GSA120T00000751001.1
MNSNSVFVRIRPVEVNTSSTTKNPPKDEVICWCPSNCTKKDRLFFDRGTVLEEYRFPTVLAPQDDNKALFDALNSRKKVVIEKKIDQDGEDELQQEGPCSSRQDNQLADDAPQAKPPSSQNDENPDQDLDTITCNVFQGINETIFCYGQTSSGKTHSVFGSEQEPGLSHHFVRSLFNYKNALAASASVDFLEVKCFEIFGDTLTDLLPEQVLEAFSPPPRRGAARGGGATSAAGGGGQQQGAFRTEQIFLKTNRFSYKVARCRTALECLDLLEHAVTNRKSGASSMNMRSSRSHCILQISADRKHRRENVRTKGTLTLVDLAGSEREFSAASAPPGLLLTAAGGGQQVGLPGSGSSVLPGSCTSTAFPEQEDLASAALSTSQKSSRNILNTSLSTLTRLLRQMQKGKLNEADKRQSVLNKALFDFVQPSCGIFLIFCVNPLLHSLCYTTSTLQMAVDCKTIKQKRKQTFLKASSKETGELRIFALDGNGFQEGGAFASKESKESLRETLKEHYDRAVLVDDYDPRVVSGRGGGAPGQREGEAEMSSGTGMLIEPAFMDAFEDEDAVARLALEAEEDLHAGLASEDGAASGSSSSLGKHRNNASGRRFLHEPHLLHGVNTTNDGNVRISAQDSLEKDLLRKNGLLLQNTAAAPPGSGGSSSSKVSSAADLQMDLGESATPSGSRSKMNYHHGKNLINTTPSVGSGSASSTVVSSEVYCRLKSKYKAMKHLHQKTIQVLVNANQKLHQEAEEMKLMKWTEDRNTKKVPDQLSGASSISASGDEGEVDPQGARRRKCIRRNTKKMQVPDQLSGASSISASGDEGEVDPQEAPPPSVRWVGKKNFHLLSQAARSMTTNERMKKAEKEDHTLETSTAAAQTIMPSSATSSCSSSREGSKRAPGKMPNSARIFKKPAKKLSSRKGSADLSDKNADAHVATGVEGVGAGAASRKNKSTSSDHDENNGSSHIDLLRLHRLMAAGAGPPAGAASTGPPSSRRAAAPETPSALSNASSRSNILRTRRSARITADDIVASRQGRASTRENKASKEQQVETPLLLSSADHSVHSLAQQVAPSVANRTGGRGAPRAGPHHPGRRRADSGDTGEAAAKVEESVSRVARRFLRSVDDHVGGGQNSVAESKLHASTKSSSKARRAHSTSQASCKKADEQAAKRKIYHTIFTQGDQEVQGGDEQDDKHLDVEDDAGAPLDFFRHGPRSRGPSNATSSHQANNVSVFSELVDSTSEENHRFDFEQFHFEDGMGKDKEKQHDHHVVDPEIALSQEHVLEQRASYSRLYRSANSASVLDYSDDSASNGEDEDAEDEEAAQRSMMLVDKSTGTAEVDAEKENAQSILAKHVAEQHESMLTAEGGEEIDRTVGSLEQMSSSIRRSLSGEVNCTKIVRRASDGTMDNASASASEGDHDHSSSSSATEKLDNSSGSSATHLDLQNIKIEHVANLAPFTTTTDTTSKQELPSNLLALAPVNMADCSTAADPDAVEHDFLSRVLKPEEVVLSRGGQVKLSSESAVSAAGTSSCTSSSSASSAVGDDENDETIDARATSVPRRTIQQELLEAETKQQEDQNVSAGFRAASASLSSIMKRATSSTSAAATSTSNVAVAVLPANKPPPGPGSSSSLSEQEKNSSGALNHAGAHQPAAAADLFAIHASPQASPILALSEPDRDQDNMQSFLSPAITTTGGGNYIANGTSTVGGRAAAGGATALIDTSSTRLLNDAVLASSGEQNDLSPIFFYSYGAGGGRLEDDQVADHHVGAPEHHTKNSDTFDKKREDVLSHEKSAKRSSATTPASKDNYKEDATSPGLEFFSGAKMVNSPGLNAVPPLTSPRDDPTSCTDPAREVEAVTKMRELPGSPKVSHFSLVEYSNKEKATCSSSSSRQEVRSIKGASIDVSEAGAAGTESTSIEEVTLTAGHTASSFVPIPVISKTGIATSSSSTKKQSNQIEPKLDAAKPKSRTNRFRPLEQEYPLSARAKSQLFGDGAAGTTSNLMARRRSSAESRVTETTARGPAVAVHQEEPALDQRVKNTKKSSASASPVDSEHSSTRAKSGTPSPVDPQSFFGKSKRQLLRDVIRSADQQLAQKEQALQRQDHNYGANVDVEAAMKDSNSNGKLHSADIVLSKTERRTGFKRPPKVERAALSTSREQSQHAVLTAQATTSPRVDTANILLPTAANMYNQHYNNTAAGVVHLAGQTHFTNTTSVPAGNSSPSSARQPAFFEQLGTHRPGDLHEEHDGYNFNRIVGEFAGASPSVAAANYDHASRIRSPIEFGNNGGGGPLGLVQQLHLNSNNQSGGVPVNNLYFQREPEAGSLASLDLGLGGGRTGQDGAAVATRRPSYGTGFATDVYMESMQAQQQEEEFAPLALRSFEPQGYYDTNTAAPQRRMPAPTQREQMTALSGVSAVTSGGGSSRSSSKVGSAVNGSSPPPAIPVVPGTNHGGYHHTHLLQRSRSLNGFATISEMRERQALERERAGTGASEQKGISPLDTRPDIYFGTPLLEKDPSARSFVSVTTEPAEQNLHFVSPEKISMTSSSKRNKFVPYNHDRGGVSTIHGALGAGTTHGARQTGTANTQYTPGPDYRPAHYSTSYAASSSTPFVPAGQQQISHEGGPPPPNFVISTDPGHQQQQSQALQLSTSALLLDELSFVDDAKNNGSFGDQVLVEDSLMLRGSTTSSGAATGGCIAPQLQQESSTLFTQLDHAESLAQRRQELRDEAWEAMLRNEVRSPSDGEEDGQAGKMSAAAPNFVFFGSRDSENGNQLQTAGAVPAVDVVREQDNEQDEPAKQTNKPLRSSSFTLSAPLLEDLRAIPEDGELIFDGSAVNFGRGGRIQSRDFTGADNSCTTSSYSATNIADHFVPIYVPPKDRPQENK